MIELYKVWQEFLPHFPKTSRYTLGIKIDGLFIEITELFFTAAHLNKEQKLPFVQKAAVKLDLLKFFLQISWEIKTLDNRKYLAISTPLSEIGKMLGGWIKAIK